MKYKNLYNAHHTKTPYYRSAISSFRFVISFRRFVEYRKPNQSETNSCAYHLVINISDSLPSGFGITNNCMENQGLYQNEITRKPNGIHVIKRVISVFLSGQNWLDMQFRTLKELLILNRNYAELAKVWTLMTKFYCCLVIR